VPCRIYWCSVGSKGNGFPGPARRSTRHRYGSRTSAGDVESVSAKGDSPADVRWSEYTLEPDQRIIEQRESYHAKFAADADGGADEYRADLDEVTWRTLKVGLKCRLKVGAFNDRSPDNHSYNQVYLLYE
jgi:hypothetical protein